MILVLIMGGVLWGGGVWFHAPRRARVAMIILLWAAVVGLHVILPDGHRVRLATGNDARIWLILAGFAIIGGLYIFGIRVLKKRANFVICSILTGAQASCLQTSLRDVKLPRETDV